MAVLEVISRPTHLPHNPPMQWTEPAGKFLVFESRLGAGSATDRHYIIPLRPHRMEQELKILETAIADAGYWRWWTSQLPDSVQLEFGGTQLWFPPTSPDRVTSGLVAIRLRKPSLAAFLTAEGAGLPDDWPEAMQRDAYEPFTVEYDRFTVTSHDDAAAYLANAASVKAVVGAPSDLPKHRGSALLAFWSGPVGFIAAAASMSLFSMHGEVDLASVSELHSKWWSYWKEYWGRKDTPDPMPHDYACEVCIPAGEE